MLYKSKKHLCYTNQEKKPNIYVWSIHCDKKYLHLDQISKQNTSWFEHPLEPEDQMRVFFFYFNCIVIMLLCHTLVVFVQWIKMAQLI